VSFLTGGDEGAAFYRAQLNHANELMDILDSKYQHILPAVLDPSRLPTVEEDAEVVVTDTSQSFDVREFLERYGDGSPMVDTLTSMLTERYT